MDKTHASNPAVDPEVIRAMSDYVQPMVERGELSLYTLFAIIMVMQDNDEELSVETLAKHIDHELKRTNEGAPHEEP